MPRHSPYALSSLTINLIESSKWEVKSGKFKRTFNSTHTVNLLNSMYTSLLRRCALSAISVLCPSIQFSKNFSFTLFECNKHHRRHWSRSVILVDLDLFWGKKYLDFKNFFTFVKPKAKKLWFCFRKVGDFQVAKKCGLKSLTSVSETLSHPKKLLHSSLSVINSTTTPPSCQGLFYSRSLDERSSTKALQDTI